MNTDQSRSSKINHDDPTDEGSSPDIDELWRGAQGTPQEAQEWDSYWDSLNDSQPIFRLEATDYVQRFVKTFPDSSSARVLDFGCGFGLLSEALSEHVGKIVVWDTSPNMRKIAHRRLAKKGNVGFASQEGIKTDSSLGEFDFVLVNSVIQYMSFDEFCGWLARWKELLAADGRIVVSDIITPNYSFVRDLTAFLTVCLRNGVFLKSVWAGLKEIRNYSTTKSSRPLLNLDGAQVRKAAGSAGLAVEILPNNLTYHHGRITAVYRRRPASN